MSTASQHPTLSGQCLAEFLGTALLIFFGDGDVVGDGLGHRDQDRPRHCRAEGVRGRADYSRDYHPCGTRGCPHVQGS